MDNLYQPHKLNPDDWKPSQTAGGAKGNLRQISIFKDKWHNRIKQSEKFFRVGK
jgi:hypothetical protein